MLTLALIIAAALVVAQLTARLGDRLMRGFERIGRAHPLAPAAMVALLAFILFALPSLLWGVPLPRIHDEFAYLLAGDTFAHGRLSNPTPPFWESFETFHELMRPTYAAKFPPGQGAALAIGFLWGLPIIGVWLSTAVACGAITWALEAVVPKRWATLGGLVSIFVPVTISWSQSYWGGGVAMLGGALLLGAALRVRRAAATLTIGAILGIALALLMNSRPLEGLITTACVFASIALFRWINVHRVARLALGAAIVLIPVIAWMGYYNSRVTGHALTLPYVEHARQYMVAPLLFYQKPKTVPPEYHHDLMYEFHVGAEPFEAREVSTSHFTPRISGIWWKAYDLVQAFIFPITLVLPIVFGVCAARRKGAARLALVVCLAMPLLHMLITPWFRPVYFAPIAPCFFTLIAIGLWKIARWRGAIGGLLVRTLLITQIVVACLWTRTHALLNGRGDPVHRAAIVEKLSALPKRSLVFVRYGPHHPPTDEWVFNGADIEGAKVIFARSMGPDVDRKLVEHFADRRIWLVTHDGEQVSASEVSRAEIEASPNR